MDLGGLGLIPDKDMQCHSAKGFCGVGFIPCGMLAVWMGLAKTVIALAYAAVT